LNDTGDRFQDVIIRCEGVEMAKNHVNGEKKRDLFLYALSTCGWCRKTKELLQALNVEFNYTDVDLLSGKERTNVMDELKKWNPRCSFPSLVIDNQKCIVGFDEKQIREVLKS
jgi:glutaredoxin-like protein NrdH